MLINHFRESFEAIVTNITLDDFKLDANKFIFEKILESPAEESEKILSDIAERYILAQTEKNYKTLDFYKQMRI